MLQGDQGKVVDGHMVERRRGPLGVSRTALHVLQETIHFLCDLGCQLGLGDWGWLAPPVLRPHLLGPWGTIGPL
jgi:hypothetical protein